jgi:CubicO group peptidase (beta-lactamase class C family)
MTLRISPVTLITVTLMAACAQAETKPLKAAAEEIAKGLPAGVIVTAERVSEKVEYSAAGRLEPKGTAPEAVIFEIGSITKVFTALLLAQATVEGKVTLETTVAQVMGPAQRFDDPRVGAITLRQLATHTSGLPRLPENLGKDAETADPYAHYDRARLEAGLQHTKLTDEGPFAMSYSNFGVGLLGELLAQRYGRPWASLIEEKITGPLHMTDTVVQLSASQLARLAPPYAGKKPDHPWHLNALAGAGALHSTAADLMKFGEALLAPEKSPLAPAISLLLRPQTKNGDIGLAISILKLDGETVYEHGGGTGGYRSDLRIVPARRAVSVLLVNNAALEPTTVFALARGEKPRLNESDKLLTPEQLAAYEGTYRLDNDHVFTMVRRDGALWTRLTGQPFNRLYPHEQTDRFFFKVVPAELQFQRAGDKIVSVTLFQNGRELNAKRIDEPAPRILFPTAGELQAYAGTYTLAPGAELTFSVIGDTLFAQLTGQAAVPVFATAADRFAYDVVKADLEFERSPDGKVKAVVLHQNGQSPRAVKKP